MRYFSLALLASLWISNTAFALGGSTCVEATVVGALPYTDSGQLESGFDPNCSGVPVNDLFYVFTAPNSGTFRFDMCGSNSCCDQLTRIWTDGTCCSGASEAVSSGCVDGYPLYDLAMTSGQVVYIEVGKSGSEWGVAPLYQLSVTQLPSPVGASCNNAIGVGMLPFSSNGLIYSMTNDISICGSGGSDAFYAMLLPGSGWVQASLCTGTNFNSVLAVRTGGPCPGSTEVACQDNNCGDDAVIDFFASADSIYYLIVDAYGTTNPSDTYTLYVTASDTCPGRTIPSLPFTENATTAGSTDNYEVCGFSTWTDVVYSFAATESILLDAKVSSSSQGDYSLSVIQGQCPLDCTHLTGQLG